MAKSPAAKTMTHAIDESKLDPELLPPVPNEILAFSRHNDVAPSKGIPVLRRPDREEWITLRIEAMLCTHLWKRAREGTEYDVDYYYFMPHLRDRVTSKLKPFFIVPYYSWTKDRHNLYLTTACAPGKNKWGDSMYALISKSAEWHSASKVTIQAGDGCYDIHQLENEGELPPWPIEETGALLATALGPKFYISTADHPAFATIKIGTPVK